MIEKIENVMAIIFYSVGIISLVVAMIVGIYGKSTLEKVEDELASYCIDSYYKDVLKEIEVSE